MQCKKIYTSKTCLRYLDYYFKINKYIFKNEKNSFKLGIKSTS